MRVDIDAVFTMNINAGWDLVQQRAQTEQIIKAGIHNNGNAGCDLDQLNAPFGIILESRQSKKEGKKERI